MTRWLVASLTAGSILGACFGHTAPDGSEPQLHTETSIVVVRPGGQNSVQITVELARTPEVIQRGLMYRRHLPAGHGMLFFMGEERVHNFWMANTYIPLDIIFIGRDWRVVGVAANAQPLTESDRTVGLPSLYVLEANAGWAAAHDIVPGTLVTLTNVDQTRE